MAATRDSSQGVVDGTCWTICPHRPGLGATNQAGRIRPERMGDWICKAGGVGNLDYYVKEEGRPKGIE